MGATQKWVQDDVELDFHLAVPPPGSAQTWPAGLLGLDHGCHALPYVGLLGLGLEDDGRGCVEHLPLVPVLGVVLDEVGLGVEEELVW